MVSIIVAKWWNKAAEQAIIGLIRRQAAQAESLGDRRHAVSI